jgi:hypothetical protein
MRRYPPLVPLPSRMPLNPCVCGDPKCDVIFQDEPLLSPARLLGAWLSWQGYQREGINVGSLRRFLRFHRREQARLQVEGEDYGGIKASA